MKAPLITMTMLLLSLSVLSQPFKAPGYTRPGATRQYYQRLYEEEATAFPRLYEQKDFDSISWYLQQRWQGNVTEPDLLCQAILLAMQRNLFSLTEFTDQDAFTPRFIGQLRAYADTRAYAEKGNSSACFHAHPGFDAVNINKAYFAAMALWAADLLQTRRPDSVETFLCHVFTGDIRYPDRQLWEGDPGLPVARSQSVSHKVSGVLTIGAGTWFPSGHLFHLGDHPEIDFGLGGRGKKNEFDIDWALRFVNTQQPYTIVRNDTPWSRHYFTGGYFGLDYTRYIISRYRFEAGPTAGIGIDFIDVADDDDNNDSGLSPTEIHSFNYNLGIRFNYYTHRNVFLDLTARYHFLNYNNPGGSPFDGNAFTIDLQIGIVSLH